MVTHVLSWVTKALLDTSVALKSFRIQRILFFTEMYLKDVGIDLDSDTCPFCGRRVGDLRKHLRKKNTKCYNRLALAIHEAYKAYRWTSMLIEDVKSKSTIRRAKCLKCGFEGFWFQTLTHAYIEHVRPHLIPVYTAKRNRRIRVK